MNPIPIPQDYDEVLALEAAGWTIDYQLGVMHPPEVKENTRNPSIRSIDLTPTTSALETGRINIIQQTGRVDFISPDEQVHVLTPGITVGGNLDNLPYADRDDQRWFQIDTPGGVLIYDKYTDSYMSFTDEYRAAAGLPPIQEGVFGSGTGGSGSAEEIEVPPPTFDEARATLESAIPNFKFYNTTNPTELLGQGQDGTQGVYRFNPRTGEFTLVSQGLNINARSQDIPELPTLDATLLAHQGENAIINAFYDEFGYNPTLAEMTDWLGTSSAKQTSDEYQNLLMNQTIAQAFPGRIWDAPQGTPEDIIANLTASGKDPTGRLAQSLIAMNLLSRLTNPFDTERTAPYINEAGQVIPGSGGPVFGTALQPWEQAAFSQGYTSKNDAGEWVSDNASIWNTETGEWEAQTTTDQRLMQDYSAGPGDPQRYANAYDQALGLGYGIDPSVRGWTITLPDGKNMGSYATQEEAQQALAVFMLRKAQAELEQPKFWEQPKLGMSAAALRSTTPFGSVPGPENTYTSQPPKYPKGPTLPDLPPPVDTTPPEQETLPDPYKLPVYAFDEGGYAGFDPSVKLDPSQVIDRRSPFYSGATAATVPPEFNYNQAVLRMKTDWLRQILEGLTPFENGGNVSITPPSFSGSGGLLDYFKGEETRAPSYNGSVWDFLTAGKASHPDEGTGVVSEYEPYGGPQMEYDIMMKALSTGADVDTAIKIAQSHLAAHQGGLDSGPTSFQNRSLNAPAVTGFQEVLRQLMGMREANAGSGVFGFADGGSVNTAQNVGIPGQQPHLMLDEPAVLTGLKSGRPYAIAGEAGTKEAVSQAPDGGLNFTPTSTPQSGPSIPPLSPVQQAERANNWQLVSSLTGQPLSQVLRNAAAKKSRPAFA